jgi:hypothetical protein
MLAFHAFPTPLTNCLITSGFGFRSMVAYLIFKSRRNPLDSDTV